MVFSPIERRIGQVLLNGSARKKLSADVREAYSAAVDGLRERDLQGLQAELKLKRRKLLGSEKGEDYIQLTYQDSKGKSRKFALDNRSEAQTVAEYLQGAIAKAKTMTGDSVKSGMPSSKGYDQFRQALVENQALEDNLPENAKVVFKRSGLTGHKKAHISVPYTNENGGVSYLTQVRKKAKGRNISEFVGEQYRQANLDFENSLRGQGLSSIRQLRQEVAKIRNDYSQHALLKSENAWQPVLTDASTLARNTPQDASEYLAAVERIAQASRAAGERTNVATRTQADRQFFEQKGQEYNDLRTRIQNSPSKNKDSINLEQEQRQAASLYETTLNSQSGQYNREINQKFDEAQNAFEHALRARGEEAVVNTETSASAGGGIASTLYSYVPSRQQIQGVFGTLRNILGSIV